MSTLKVDGFGSVEVLRAFHGLGLAPGDLAAAITEEAERAIKIAKGDRRKAVNLGLRRMRRNGRSPMPT